jgi:hypothetical protein
LERDFSRASHHRQSALSCDSNTERRLSYRLSFHTVTIRGLYEKNTSPLVRIRSNFTLCSLNLKEEVFFSSPIRRRGFVCRPVTTFHTVTGDERTKRKRNRRRRRVRLKRTNLRVKGLSLNRSQKWTALLSTTPRLRPRSSTNDLAPLHRTWLISLSARGRVVSASAKSRRAVA